MRPFLNRLLAHRDMENQDLDNLEESLPEISDDETRGNPLGSEEQEIAEELRNLENELNTWKEKEKSSGKKYKTTEKIHNELKQKFGFLERLHKSQE